MARYAIVPNYVILVAGVEVTPDQHIATIETDLPIHDVLSLSQFKHASVVDLDAPEEDGNDDMQSPFAAYSAKTQQALAKAAIESLPQAALWLRDNHDFAKSGIAKSVAAELVKQIAAASIPTP